MQISLERGDLLQLDPISSTGTVKLLPPGKKYKQKLIVGDDGGNVGCYEFKRGEPQTVFLTRPFDGPISSIAIGGNSQKRDKIFASHSQRIIGVTKKGKDFFKLTSSLTEEIRNMVVEDTRIWTGCEYIYSLYDNGLDTAFYMSRDQINALIIEHITRDTDYDVVLGCKDNCIRIIQGSQLAIEIPTLGPVSCITSRANDESRIRKGPASLLYGMESGAIASVQVNPDGNFAYMWSMDDGTKRSPVTCVKMHDLLKDGTQQIIAGRDDGRVEVFSPDAGGFVNRSQLGFSKDLGETIRSLECGMVNNPQYSEIIVTSYSGKIISFTTEPVLQRATDDSYGRSIQTVSNENQLKYLRKEVDELKKKLEKEKEKVKKVPGSSSAAAAPKAIVDVPINSKFLFDKDVAAYVLTIEIQSPIDIVILRSPVHLDLVDSEVGTSVVSITPPHLLTQGPAEEMPNKFVAAFRCQAQERRISITLRSTEGEYGDLLVTVVAALTPKAAKVLRFPLKPLSLHHKVHMVLDADLARPRNRLRFSGQVALSTLHEWVQTLLPDVPPRLTDDAIEERASYRNAFTGANTLCEYRKNEIIFEAECASTIAIAKESITRLANYRRVQLEEALGASDASIPSFLSLLRPRLSHQLSLVRKMELVDAVQEIAMQETDTSWLSPEYAEILKEQETIRRDFKGRARSLEYISGIVTDLFVDWNRLHGSDVRGKIGALQQLILSGDFDALVDAVLNTRKAEAERASASRGRK